MGGTGYRPQGEWTPTPKDIELLRSFSKQWEESEPSVVAGWVRFSRGRPLFGPVNVPGGFDPVPFMAGYFYAAGLAAGAEVA